MSTVQVNNLSNVAGSKLRSTADVIDGAAKAWVNFNGTGVVAIRAAFNVSSITDNGTGDYTVNFTIPLPDANYVVSGNAASAGAAVGVLAAVFTAAPTASAFRVGTYTLASPAPSDFTSDFVVVHR